jgi:hypothetical protein
MFDNLLFSIQSWFWIERSADDDLRRETIEAPHDDYVNAKTEIDRDHFRKEIFRHDPNGKFAKQYLRELRIRIINAQEYLDIERFDELDIRRSEKELASMKSMLKRLELIRNENA